MKDYDHFGSTPRAKKTKEKMTQEMVRARAAAIVHGTDPSAELHVVDEKIKQLVTRLQSWYRGHIVRRTIRSLDPTGKAIWGAKPPVEMIITLNLSERETLTILTKAEDMALRATIAWQFVSPSAPLPRHC